jgi:VWFA-related protein
MSSISQKTLVGLLSLALLFETAFPAPGWSQDAQVAPPKAGIGSPRQTRFKIRIDTNLVLVNVVVRDKHGNLVRGMTRDEFQLFEDGKQQTISDFDFENVDVTSVAGQTESTVAGVAAAPAGSKPLPQPLAEAKDRRLVILFFDFTAMDPEQIDRSVKAGQRYVEKQMSPVDLVALVSLASSMRLDVDFTADKDQIEKRLAAYTSGQGQGFDSGDTGSAEGAPETGGSFTADDSDYNAFNTDRKLLALESLMQTLGGIQQKKSIVYFSNGISRSGIENQSALRSTTAMAVKTNCSIYPVDIRGLAALPPGGEAQSASLHGVSAYSGQSVINQFESNASSQETLSTLAGDTGGKAFFDTNDFGLVFQKVQQDTSAYYVLGFYSNNPLQDGKFRRLQVRVKSPDVKIDYRRGYYAPRDFKHFRQEDREQQMQDELASELSETDVNLYLGAAYFRVDASHYFIPVSLVVPGSQIPFTQVNDKDKATIDVIGAVRDSAGVPFGSVRDTVTLSLDTSQQVRRKNVQYNTGFILPHGSYHMKFVVRENQTGRLGSFETDLKVPDLSKAPLKMSSVVLSHQRIPSTRKEGQNPLLRDGMELVQSVTHVFATNQHLFLQYEVYDPAKRKETVPAAAAPGAAAAGGKPKDAPRETIRLLTSLLFLQGTRKVYETKPLEAKELTESGRKVVIFQIDLPLDSFPPGLYTCQVNVIDDAAGSFAFPRTLLLIKSPLPETAGATGGRD